MGGITQAGVIRQRHPRLGRALRQCVEAMEVMFDAPARALGKLLAEGRMVGSVLPIGAETAVDRLHLAVERRHRRARSEERRAGNEGVHRWSSWWSPLP